MATNYKINNVDIDEIYETFETSVAEQYGVTDSKFTDSTAKFKKNGQPLNIPHKCRDASLRFEHLYSIQGKWAVY